MKTPAALSARITKELRMRGAGVRRMYIAARQAERFLRDAPRRAMMRAIPASALVIPQDRGFLVLPPQHFEETAAIVRESRAALAQFDLAAVARKKDGKRFLVNVLDPSTLTLGSAIIRLALREDVLAAVCRYLGVVPFLSAIAVFHSDTTDRELISSQLYHCDGDDATQMKIFVHCTDVDEGSGPLTVLDAASSARVRRQLGYQFRHRLTDEQVRRVVGGSPEHAIVGPVGTTTFVDTSRCFHYGSRVARDAAPRLVTMIQYQTPYSFTLPTSAQASLPFRRLLGPALTSLQRLVLGE